MKILLILNEEWNDRLHGNNNVTNWFFGMKNVEFANIYCSPELPENKCCKKYFQISDSMMAKSIFKGVAGIPIYYDDYPKYDSSVKSEGEELKGFYSKMKSLASEPVRAIRDLIWLFGRYDKKALKKFIDDFNPDIVFTQRLATVKLLRLESIIMKMTDAPFVAFTGDDEYSLKHISFSPTFWLRRLNLRRWFRKVAKNYKLYYTHSKKQADEYNKLLNIPTKTIAKCGNFDEKNVHKDLHDPIKIVYAGQLYCNRWKTLSKLAEALKTVNKEQTRIILQIYSRAELTDKQDKLLNDKKNVFFMGGVSPDKLPKVFEDADIVLHAESFDLKYRLITKYSFSTKIVDCLSCGCAVMAICDENQTGFVHLKENDAAICISNEKDIYPTIKSIADDKSIILEYAKKATECGKKNHDADEIRKMLYDDFSEIIRISGRKN